MAVIGATQLEPVNILGSYVQGMELGRANRLAQQQQAVQMEAARQEAELRNYLSSADLSSPEVQNQLLRFGPQGAEMAKNLATMGTQRSQAAKADYEAQSQRLKDMYNLVTSAVDELSYARVRGMAANMGLDVAQIPEQYDPVFVEQARNAVLTASERLDAELKARTTGVQERQVALAERKQGFEERKGDGGAGGEKPPQGYRWRADGGLEPIPGGPADTKNQQKASELESGRGEVNTQVATLRDFYKQLDEMKAITSVRRSRAENIRAAAESSELGQAAGRAVGSEAQSIRNSIKQQRPLLLQAIKRATGMTAKQMDSNVELQLYLSAATDPTLDIDANLRALDNLDRLYGLGVAGPTSGGPTSRGRGSPRPASNVDALLEKYKE
jgi:hypothetical protein